jgi:hypothetical protein
MGANATWLSSLILMLRFVARSLSEDDPARRLSRRMVVQEPI